MKAAARMPPLTASSKSRSLELGIRKTPAVSNQVKPRSKTGKAAAAVAKYANIGRDSRQKIHPAIAKPNNPDATIIASGID